MMLMIDDVISAVRSRYCLKRASVSVSVCVSVCPCENKLLTRRWCSLLLRWLLSRWRLTLRLILIFRPDPTPITVPTRRSANTVTVNAYLSHSEWQCASMRDGIKGRPSFSKSTKHTQSVCWVFACVMVFAWLLSEDPYQWLYRVRHKKVSPYYFFAIFSAITWNFFAKFYTLVQSSYTYILVLTSFNYRILF